MANVAIVGTGWGARVQVPAFGEAGLSIAGIAGFHQNKTRRLGEELGVRSFDNWRELIALPEVDLVSVVTPPFEHLEMTTAALEAGKHVISEKPTAMDASQAQKLVDCARRHREALSLIDHELRFLPAWITARQRINEIGALRYIEVRYASPGRGDRSREWNWWSDASKGGGIWGAVGSHYVDAIRYLGFEVEAVQAELRTIIADRPYGDGKRKVTSDDYANVQLRLANGAIASIALSAVASGPDESATITIHGESGSMRLAGEQLLICEPLKPFRLLAGGELQQRPGNSPGGAFGSGTVLLGQALRAAIDDGDRTALSPAATFNDGLEQQKVLDAARTSAADGGQWKRV